MKFSELAVLLPCHSLEDFPIYQEGEQADQLLTAWSALWHPALINSAGAVPTWHRLDVLPDSLAGRLITVPPFCTDRLPAGWMARAKNEGARVISETNRAQAVEQALVDLDGQDRGVDERLAGDFLALGFCRLQIELLTRQMRYSVNIDESHFQQEVVAAAQAAVTHDVTAARTHLGQCYDTLHEARKHFYPADFYLLDITLAAEQSVASSLVADLRDPRPTNLLITTLQLGRIAADAATWPVLLAAMDAGSLAVLGGEPEELELPVLPLESVLKSLGDGVRDYEALLGRRPRVYGRRRAGLWPALPQLLTKLGYHGALHCTLDDGRFPLASQAKTRWEGLDGNVVDIFARVPSDAARSDTFLGLSRKMADSMDNDHVASLSLAHWPSVASPWYDDLRRIAALSPVLGKFILLDEFFSQTDMPGRLSRFEADEYRTPYLKQAVIRRQCDPISRYVLAHRDQAARASRDATATLAALASGNVQQDQPDEEHVRPAQSTVDAESARALARLAAAMPRQDGPAASRHLIVNTLSFARKIGVEIAASQQSAPSGSDQAASATSAPRQFSVVDVPGMGFVWVDPGTATKAAPRAKSIAADNVLRNEFFEATISRNTGGIQSLYSFAKRGNQLSQQIAMRSAAPPPAEGQPWHANDAEAVYTSMKAESVQTTVSSPALGEIVSSGKLLDAAGRPIADFRQTTQLWAGSRVLRIEIELANIEEPRADPWNSYYAARFAWPEDTAELWRGVSLGRQPTEAARIEAPEFIEIGNGTGTITILTGGLPFHRRSQDRMLDSLLVVRGETARRFTLGIGVDVPQAAAAAQELIAPATSLLDVGPPPTLTSGWFFHIGAKNVVATHWQPLLLDRPGEPSSAGPRQVVGGFRARLLETAGRSGRVSLRAFRPVAVARQIDYLGQTLLEVPVEDDKIRLDFAAHEWIELEAVWS
jgi:alpha-mannosidase